MKSKGTINEINHIKKLLWALTCKYDKKRVMRSQSYSNIFFFLKKKKCLQCYEKKKKNSKQQQRDFV
jgi:hypothetical protein